MLLLSNFAVGLIIASALVAVAKRSPKSSARLLAGLTLWSAILAPLGVLALYVAACFYMYRPHAYRAFLTEIFEALRSATGRPWSVLYVGAVLGVLAATGRFQQRARHVAILLLLLLAFLTLQGGTAHAAADELEAGPPSPDALRMLVTSNQIVFIPTPKGLEAICWCGPRDWSARPARLLRLATVAIEDQRFFDHRGADPRSMVRAIVGALLGRRVEGASTLTQQLIKNSILTSKREFNRKLDEIQLSVKLEEIMSKDEILEAYLKQVHFSWANGRPIVGAEQAARHYFGRHVSDLNLRESVLLAGMLKGPATYDPILYPERAWGRARLVLDAMVNQNMISRLEADAAGRGARPRGPHRPLFAYTGPFMRSVISDIVAAKPGFQFNVSTRIPITLDYAAQAKAEASLERLRLPTAFDGVELGYVRMSRDGRILVMLAQRDPGGTTMNYSTQAKRQPASTFKSFVYTKALSENIIKISPTVINAFANSSNDLPLMLAQRLGPQAVATFVRSLGVRSELRPDATLALGTSEMTLTELVGAYAAVFQGGTRLEPYGYLGMVHEGSVQMRAPVPPHRQIDAKTLASLNILMRAVVRSGTGRAAAGIPGAIGKTGTSDDNRDGWFVGVLPKTVSGIWLGHPRNLPVPGLAGSKAAAVWSQIEAPLR